MDIVYLHGIEVDCVIGVLDWERKVTQKIIIDLDVGHALCKAGNTDNLDDTLNYKELLEKVSNFCIKRQAMLVETLASGIAEIILSEFGCPWCRVKINKPGALRGVRDVGVIIERAV